MQTAYPQQARQVSKKRLSRLELLQQSDLIIIQDARGGPGGDGGADESWGEDGDGGGSTQSLHAMSLIPQPTYSAGVFLYITNSTQQTCTRLNRTSVEVCAHTCLRRSEHKRNNMHACMCTHTFTLGTCTFTRTHSHELVERLEQLTICVRMSIHTCTHI